MDCGATTAVSDLDEPAVCGACMASGRERESVLAAGDRQAGAQHVGRERLTRDDYERGGT